MAFPSHLREAIEEECGSIDRSRLSRAAEQITSDYKAAKFAGTLATPESRAAYLIARFPATFAANLSIFQEIARLAPEFAPTSLLDLGAGPGTASWAAADVWNSLTGFTLVEGNREMTAIGRRLATGSEKLNSTHWIEADLRSAEFPSADMVVLSYAIGELKDASAIVNRAWKTARRLLVIVEPGTPKNFSQIAQLRRELIAKGAHLVAPCPHENECPMLVAGDWCHFSVRLERTAEHRRLKGGALGYEDEKFSYVAFSKEPRRTAAARIIRHPLVYSGHIKLTLCESEGLTNITVTKSQKEKFRAARRAKWGDEWCQLE